MSTDKFTLDLYGLTEGQLRDLVLVLAMQKRVKDVAQAHMDLMRGDSTKMRDSAVPLMNANNFPVPPSTPPHQQLPWYPATPEDTAVTASSSPSTTKSTSSEKKAKKITMKAITKRTPAMQNAAITKTTPIKSGAGRAQAAAAAASTKLTPLFHTCKHCQSRFKQQNNHVYACSYHPGHLVEGITEIPVAYGSDYSVRTSPRLPRYTCCGKGLTGLGCEFRKHEVETVEL